MMPTYEFSNLSAADLRRLARDLRHRARTPGTDAREGRVLLLRAAHAAELAEQKEPWPPKFRERAHFG
jgi:hypothetical protein